MTILKTFSAFRPKPDIVSKVAALPYDVMNKEEAKDSVKNNPYSFLNIDKPEIYFDDSEKHDKNEIYEHARKYLDRMIEEGIYEQDSTPSLYLYKLTMGKHSQIGVVGCVPIDAYIDNDIKKHELTRADKEQDRINHVDTCNAHTGPIFLTYNKEFTIDEIIEEYIEKIQSAFEKVPNLYIADGHHRAAAAVKVGLQRRRKNPNYTGEEEFNYFLAVLFPDKQLKILDYNRVVKDLNGLTKERFLSAIEPYFTVNIWDEKEPYTPETPHSFGMYLENQWYILKAKEEIIDRSNPLFSLDVFILQKYLLSPILGIEDPRTDERIDFIGGIRGLKEIEYRVDTDMKVGFSLYPTTIEELMTLADLNKTMPPKSTWFEPKLRSGIFIHRL
ncbi:DUF1015 domain-containing protein [Anaerosalibacter bizertensis]|uniref:DUF1015 domain-containing protein n=1 Tax=Anaerosalibacter bizertensis TaxID=932217 RepID=A0A844FJ98_9FIRM|nr:DUF1015 family protein [Anaerosalibacter bizertensis]MSS44040.1 DUF1015 domain-containing protein [Anaerosalibacter bizertensis]